MTKLLSLPQRSRRASLNTSAPTPEHILDRQEKAFDMRRQGLKLETIAERLGIAVSTVHNDLRQIAKMKYQGLIEKDELLLLEQNAYYDALLEKLLPLALSNDLNVGETRLNRRGEEYDISLEAWKSSLEATDRVLKVLEGKAKINGLMAQGNAKTAEEAGTSAAMKVLQAFAEAAQKSIPLRAEVIDGPTGA